KKRAVDRPPRKGGEPMVRVHSQRPAVAIFIFASTNEFTNSPHTKAINEASAMRQVDPNAISYAPWLCQNGAGGSLTMTHAITAANASAVKPAQITRRERA